MRIPISRPSAAFVVSMIALSVAMGGTGYAASQIGSAQIRNNSIRSVDVRNGTLVSRDVAKDTLTGRNIREGTLHVQHVANYVTFNVAMNRGDARRKLVKAGPVTLYGTCDDDAGTNAHGFVTATTTAPHTYTYDDHDLNPGETGSIGDYDSTLNNGTDTQWTSIEPMFFSGDAGGSFDGDGESMGIIIGGPGADCRFVGSLNLIPASR